MRMEYGKMPLKKGFMAAKFKEFHLIRIEDVHGVSGTGLVARGIVFPKDNKCAMEWESDYDTITMFGSIEEIVAIHGHDGKTKVVMGPPKVKRKKRKPKIKVIE